MTLMPKPAEEAGDEDQYAQNADVTTPWRSMKRMYSRVPAVLQPLPFLVLLVLAGLAVSSRIYTSAEPSPSSNLSVASSNLSSITSSSTAAVAIASCGVPPTSRYDLAALLNVQTFTNITDTPRASSVTSAIRLSTPYVCARPDSILAYYTRLPSVCATRPYRPHLHAAITSYVAQMPATGDLADLLAVVRGSRTLVVQLHEANPIKPDLEAAIRLRALLMMRVVVVQTGSSVHAANANAVAALARTVNPEIRIQLHRAEDDDDALVLLSQARLALLQAGGIAAVAMLGSTEQTYFTKGLTPYTRNTAFRWQLQHSQRGNHATMDAYPAEWSRVAPVTPSCCSVEHLGRGDGEKFICSNTAALKHPRCWVLSIGCGGLWEFERLVVSRWNCSIHVFDCTGSWNVPADLASRVTLSKLCVGGAGSERRPNHRSLEDLIKLSAGRMPGMPKMPALLKLDAEGYEYPVLHDLLMRADSGVLPQQMVIEFHLTVWTNVGFLYERDWNNRARYRMSEANAMALANNLTSRGYRVVHRADNPTDATCSELTLVLEDDLPPVSPPS